MTSDEIWITADGKRMAVGDMSEQHAKNALRLVIRRLRDDYTGCVSGELWADVASRSSGDVDWWK